MKHIIKYVGGRTFMYPNGALATPEKILEDFPAILAFPHIIETDENEEVLFAVQNLSAARSMYNIDKALSEEEAIAKINEIVNTEPEEVEQEPTAEERTATALEAMASGQTTENAKALNALLTGEE